MRQLIYIYIFFNYVSKYSWWAQIFCRWYNVDSIVEKWLIYWTVPCTKIFSWRWNILMHYYGNMRAYCGIVTKYYLNRTPQLVVRTIYYYNFVVYLYGHSTLRPLHESINVLPFSLYERNLRMFHASSAYQG